VICMDFMLMLHISEATCDFVSMVCCLSLKISTETLFFNEFNNECR